MNSAPKDELTVSYGNDKMMMGNNFTLLKTISRPEVSYEFQKDEYYALVLLDADPFSEKCPFGGEFLMWLIVNIRDKVRNGEEIVGYQCPFPLPGTGTHRYPILLYKQPKKISFDERSDSPFDIDSRLFFSVKSFAKKYNLDDPIAGNYFTVGFNLPFFNGNFNITELLQ
ncbi:Similar to OV16: OV-16 antigen (Onchocerca volvulus) [Cotesia congregata]|uniref:Similar to OV16: OV-16 antigen (Onchocerca volvulus) n=1 Tax=Cotesia congregata TaxID=51543 RepID=A0A8J2ECV4_COTCN|nr:Similar to OV16: OV-16 antigen (Onchocerca volvulus) [Cotesia congregata]